MNPAQRDLSAVPDVPPAANSGPPPTLPNFEEILQQTKFDQSNPPEKPTPVFTIQGQTIATSGNLVVIQALMKAGKSAVVAACCAAAMRPGTEHLGFTCGVEGGQILHFDCEQSRYDHHALILRALKRAGQELAPDWLQSHWFTQLSLEIRREAFFYAVEKAAARGRIRAVFLDGVADILADPNNPMEAFSLVERLQQAAIRHHTVIVALIHENPGGSEGKTRGHVGSQLQRKAETNLRLAKDADGITTIYSDYSRHCHIPKSKGPRFQWGDEEQMHVTVAPKANTDADARRQEMEQEAEAVFETAPGGLLGYAELLRTIGKTFDLKPDGAKSRYRKLKEAGVIQKTVDGDWRRAFKQAPRV